MSINHLHKIALLAGALALVGCSADVTEPVHNPGTGEAFLNIRSVNINRTRTIIDGTEFADSSQYLLCCYDSKISWQFITNDPVPVTIVNGKSEISRPIPLGTKPIDVLGVYPEEVQWESDYGFIVYPGTTDYMVAHATRDGEKVQPSAENTVIDLKFEHVMSRITLRVKDTRLQGDEYNKIGELYLGSNGREQAPHIYYKITSGKYEPMGTSTEVVVRGTNDNYLLYPGTVCNYDFLVVPSTPNQGEEPLVWDFRLSAGDINGWYQLPATAYAPGSQYTFDIVIEQKEQGPALVISQAQIYPWVITDIPEIKVP